MGCALRARACGDEGSPEIQTKTASEAGPAARRDDELTGSTALAWHDLM